jgi:hypothetical protein
MIRFSLRCKEAHRFDSWFGSGADFDQLQQAGLVACAVCGSTEVEKDLMTPNIAGAPAAAGDERPLSAPASTAEQAMAELRRRIEATSEDVGRNFAAEARKIHDGEAPARPIIGEAKPAEAKALIEDGISVAPLPWSSRKTN